MKKFFALLLSLVMILGLATTAFAATTKVTINDATVYPSGTSPIEHQYEAYKLMAVSVNTEGDKFSYDVEDKYAGVMKTVLGLADTATDAEIVAAVQALANAEAVHDFVNELYRQIQDAGLTHDFPTTGTWNGSQQELDQGYWLIADVTDLEDKPYANSLVMVDTVFKNSVTINNKPEATTTEKKIDDENDSLIAPNADNEDASSWQDVADYDIGDKVPYSIRIYMSNDIAEYEYYSFIIQDSVSQGLTYDEASFKIYVNDDDAATLAKAGSAAAATAQFVYVIETETNPEGVQTAQKLYVYPNYGYTKTDGTPVTADKENGGDFLKYFPAGTDEAKIESSVIRFVYECTLNENAIIGSTGNPNEYVLKFSNNPYGDGFGVTPEDVAIVLTYKVVVNKTDDEGTPLVGATFALYKFIAMELPDGMTDEQAVAAGYYDHPAANSWGKFELVEQIDGTAATEFSFKGIDDGYYKLEETAHPAGYNPIDPIEFHVEAEHVKDLTTGNILTSLTGTTKIGGELTFTPDTGTGSLTTTVENHTGSELPSTGGIGTTLFYVFGTIMVLGAAVLLVTKRRMAV